MCKKNMMRAIFMSCALASMSVGAITRLRCRAVVRRGAALVPLIVPVAAEPGAASQVINCTPAQFVACGCCALLAAGPVIYCIERMGGRTRPRVKND